MGKTDATLKIDNNNKRSWQNILNETDRSHRSNYCSELFGGDKFNNERCRHPHIYCKYRCNGQISNLESIINYNCYTDCVKLTQGEVIKISPVKKKELVNYLAFNPTVGAKCDYKPLGEDTYFAGTVKEIKKLGENKFAQIDYTLSDGGQRSVYVQYPNANLLACGKGLTIRTDCDK